MTTYLIGLRACSTQDRAVCSDAVLTIQVSAGDVITFCPPFVSVNVNESDAPGHVVVDLNSTKGDANITYTLQNAAQSAFSVNASTVRTLTTVRTMTTVRTLTTLGKSQNQRKNYS